MTVGSLPERIAHADTTEKLLWTAALIGAWLLLRLLVAAALRRGEDDAPLEREQERRRFWSRQIGALSIVVALIGGLLTIWAGDAGRFASVVGIVTAGIAVALQRLILSLAGYLVILRGRAYTVGDRITIGGVRGDVVSLGFIQTMVMEMGEPPSAESGDPKTWVNARQYTGRIVRVTNDRIFDAAVYNYTREFPFLWEEMHFPLPYDADMARAESILLEIATRHVTPIVERATPALRTLRTQYYMEEEPELAPRIYLRLTDNWLELSLRFVVPVHGGRRLKDAMSRDILAEFRAAGLQIASTTYEITALPTLHVVNEKPGDAVQR